MRRVKCSIFSILLMVLMINFVGCGGGAPSGGGSIPATPTVTSVSVVGQTSVEVGHTLQFTATVNGANNPSQAVTWIASSGSISSAGLFTAPSTSGTAAVKAVSVQDPTVSSSPVTVTITASATVEVKAAPRVVAVLVGSDVAAIDTGGLVAKFAGVIPKGYAARAGPYDPVVSTVVIPSPPDVAGVIKALQGVPNLWGIEAVGNVPAPWVLPSELVAQVTYSAETPSLRNIKSLVHMLTYRPEARSAEFRADDIEGLQAFTQAVVQPHVRFVVRSDHVVVENTVPYNPPTGSSPYDAPYKVPNCSRYTIASDGSVSEPADSFTPTPECEKPAWFSRIIFETPSQVLDFIQKDLNIRDTSTGLKKYGSVRGGWIGGAATNPNVSDIATYWANDALYAASEISYIDSYAATGDTAVKRLQDLEELLANGTEFVVFDGHGEPTGILIEGAGVMGTFYSSDSISLWSSDMLGLSNYARIINLISCGTGNFLVPGYFAGAALRGDNTLLVVADTMTVWVSSSYEEDQVEKKYHMLANGASFADINMAPDGPTDMFGDPTFFPRPQRTGDVPIFSVSIDGGGSFSHYHGQIADLNVPFAQASIGGAKAQQVVMLRNDGITDLAVQLTMMPEFLSVDGKDPCGSGCSGLGFILDAPNVVTVGGDTDLGNVVLTVPAGKTLPITFGLAPMAVTATGAPVYGTYTARFEIHTVDPRGGALGASDPVLGQLNLFFSGSVTK